ncbi:peptidylprolyl isomerase [Candidatus Woesearchaeota archaeon]|nr:peptidylprolyl isomerase [Candidatus Woesearchaeota archaeon]
MTQLKQNDFVQLEFTAKLKENNTIFDTSNEKTAKSSGIYNPNMPYGDYIICLGHKQILPKLEEKLVGKNVGNEYVFDLKPEEAFGKKDAKLFKLIPLKFFTKDQVNPVPGLQVNIDGSLGTVTTVTGGRVIVDFNHPFASKEVVYTVKVTRMIESPAEKVKAFLRMKYDLKNAVVNIEDSNNAATVKIEKKLIDALTPEIKAEVEKELVNVVPEIKKLGFAAK